MSTSPCPAAFVQPGEQGFHRPERPVKEIALPVPGYLGTEDGRPCAPSCHAFKAFPAASAAAFKIHPPAEGRARVTVGTDGLPALRAAVLEELRMLQGAAHQGAHPDGVGGYLEDLSSDGIGHLQIKGNEVDAVIVLPVIVAGVDGGGVLVELPGEEALLLGGAHCVPAEEIDLCHDTDFF